MAILRFPEIPPAHSGTERDQFELFAREVLVHEGFTVIAGPDRGADAGRDMIVDEVRRGPGGSSIVRWLVSCKHKAHSGHSVTPADEQNLRDRIETHGCHGLLCFYSTLPSSGLSTNLMALRRQFELNIYDPELIERKLLNNTWGHALAARFMPHSFGKWVQNSQRVLVTKTDTVVTTRNSFFVRPVHHRLEEGLAEANARGVLVFVVIYDAAHPTRSKLNYALGYFMEYQTTKRLVNDHFVVVLGASSDAALANFVPIDDPLENCLWVVLDAQGTVLRKESVYANPDEGMKRVRSVVGSFANRRALNIAVKGH